MSAESDLVLVDLALLHFVGVLTDLYRASAMHEPRFGHPPACVIIEQRVPSQHGWFNTGDPVRRWRVTQQGVVEVPLGELPSPKRLPGMYHDEGRGDFSVGANGATVRIGWQVGPRFGRGYDLSVVVEGSSVRFGEASPIWAS